MEDVNLLADPHGSSLIYVGSDELRLNQNAIAVGGLRGFTGSGDAVIYVGSSREANNTDPMSVHMIMGESRG